MCGFKRFESAEWFRRIDEEVHNFFRIRSRRNERVLHLDRIRVLMPI